jgi:hypothetical protein
MDKSGIVNMEEINAIAAFIVALKQQGFRGNVVIGMKDRNMVVKLETFVKVKDLKEFAKKPIYEIICNSES